MNSLGHVWHVVLSNSLASPLGEMAYNVAQNGKDFDSLQPTVSMFLLQMPWYAQLLGGESSSKHTGIPKCFASPRDGATSLSFCIQLFKNFGSVSPGSLKIEGNARNLIQKCDCILAVFPTFFESTSSAPWAPRQCSPPGHRLPLQWPLPPAPPTKWCLPRELLS